MRKLKSIILTVFVLNILTVNKIKTQSKDIYKSEVTSIILDEEKKSENNIKTVDETTVEKFQDIDTTNINHALSHQTSRYIIGESAYG